MDRRRGELSRRQPTRDAIERLAYEKRSAGAESAPPSSLVEA